MIATTLTAGPNGFSSEAWTIQRSSPERDTAKQLGRPRYDMAANIILIEAGTNHLGAHCLLPVLCGRIITDGNSRMPPMHDELTQREQQVPALVVDGCTNKAIGRELGISHRTVEVHRAHLMEKLGARGTADLVRLALGSGSPTRRPLSSIVRPAFALALCGLIQHHRRGVSGMPGPPGVWSEVNGVREGPGKRRAPVRKQHHAFKCLSRLERTCSRLRA